MATTKCPHCDHSIEAPQLARGQTLTCPKCQGVFLPVVMAASAPAPAAAAMTSPAPSPAPMASPARPMAPPPPPPASAQAPAAKATRAVPQAPQRVRVVACVKCRALLRLGPGASKLGRCKLCNYAFVVDERSVSELVLPAAEVDDLPVLEILAGALGADDAAGSAEATVMRTAERAAPPPPPKETVRCILVSDAPRIRYEVDKDVVLIGRVGADLTINDPDVSRRHCSVERSSGKLLVRDLKSTNGTLVNGVRVELEVLKDGDRIRVGSTDLKLVVTSEGQREKHVALFLDLGSGATPADVNHALEVFRKFGQEDLAEWKADVILSPSTGRGMAIWRVDPLVSTDERRRQVGRFLAAPASLRVELGTVPPPSGRQLSPTVGLVMGMAKRDMVSGRAKFEGPLLQKAALAVKVEARDAIFISDIESLEMLTGERGLEALTKRLHGHELKAAPAGGGQPFVLITSADALKEGMKAAQKSTVEGRALRSVASTLERELLDLLEEKCRKEFDAGLAMAYSGASKGVGGVLKKLAAAGKAPPEDLKLKTRFYERILSGSAIYLGKEDVQTWMDLLAEVGQRYVDALRAERDRQRASNDRGAEPAWNDLLALDDETLLAAGESAVLFRASLFRGESLTGADLRQLARRCSEALAAAVPPKYEPVPLPILGRVYAIFKDAIDIPSDSVDARGLFEFFVLLALSGVTHGIADAALRRAQHIGDDEEVRHVKQAYGGQLQILKGGLKTMSRVVAILRLMPALRTQGAAKSIFDRYRLPLYELVP